MPDCPTRGIPQYHHTSYWITFPHVLLTTDQQIIIEYLEMFQLVKIVDETFCQALAGSFFARFSLKLNVKGVQILGTPKVKHSPPEVEPSPQLATAAFQPSPISGAHLKMEKSHFYSSMIVHVVEKCPSQEYVFFFIFFCKSVLIVVPWNLKHQVLNVCFNWMIRNGHRGNGWYTISMHLTLIICGFLFQVQFKRSLIYISNQEKNEKNDHISSTFQLRCQLIL